MPISTREKFLSLRRRILETEAEKFNDMQKKAVFSVKGPLLILAGAGSGKTTVVVNRIAHILKYGDAYESEFIPDGVDEALLSQMERYLASGDKEILEEISPLLAADLPRPYNILAITFTNKAAGELKERLDARLPAGYADMVWSGTFHKICIKILRFDGEAVGVGKNFTVYNTDDSIQVMKECLKELSIDDKFFPPRIVLKEIGRAKDNLQTAGEYSAWAGEEFRLKTIAKLYALYEKKLRDANALDFDDIILKTVFLLRDHEEIRARWQKRFLYVTVDEYQDTNRAQYLLVSLLSGGQNNLCVVGDDDQSIYKFRGATIENILSFEKQFKNTRVIRLEENYRSTKHILDAANGVIENNKGRKGKSLWTKNGEGEKVRVVELASERDEGEFIADAINNRVAEQKRSYKDFAILYRVNAQSANIENVFLKSGVPYRIIGGLRFYDRKEVRDMLAYLFVIENASDDLRLKRIINEPKRGIGDATIELVEALAASGGASMMEVLENAQEYPVLSRSAARLKEFYAMISDLREKKDKMPLDLFLDEVYEKTGYIKALELQNTPESATRLENLMELKSNVLSYMKSAEESSLGGFLEEVTLFSDVDRYDAESDAVVLMTIHSAKGLEFPVVFLTGADEGIFPGAMVSNTEELEEERRLCYVAITRAKEELFVTTAAERLLYGRTMRYQPSRFLAEMPKGHIEFVQRRPRRTYDFTKSEIVELKSRPSVEKSPPQFAQVFAPGERVAHKVFGEGTVKSARPMGSDCLVEVLFDKAGSKKLMQNFANLVRV